jgi:peptide deformylase
MILDIVQYGHPVLRQKGARIGAVTPALRQLAVDMLETMHDAKGVGLAAQQVGQALQLTVLDIRGVTDRPSTLEIGGKPVPPEDHMPLVLVNPDLTPLSTHVKGPEGCLSFPEIYGDISRPGHIRVQALDEHGQPVEFCCGGLLAKAVQHEHDHLHGILFIDRMDKQIKEELRPELEALQSATKAKLQKVPRKAV